MLVLIKSAPDSTDGAVGLTLAKEGGADLILFQNGVYFAQKGRLANFTGAVYVLDDDKRLRGLKDSELDERVRIINYNTITDLMTEGGKVVGMF